MTELMLVVGIIGACIGFMGVFMRLDAMNKQLARIANDGVGDVPLLRARAVALRREAAELGRQNGRLGWRIHRQRLRIAELQAQLPEKVAENS